MFTVLSLKKGFCYNISMGTIRENVRQNLIQYLSLKNITQKEFALKLGVSQSAVTNWIKGKNSPDIELVAQICTILNISVNELFKSTESYSRTELEEKVIRRFHERKELQQAILILLGLENYKE